MQQQIEEKNIKRIGRPPKRPAPSLSFQNILKIRNVLIEATKNTPEAVKLQRKISFEESLEELNESVGRFFAAGYDLADGVAMVQNLGLHLTDAEIKSILVQAQIRYMSTERRR
jgi:hypothetical protein